MLMLLLIDRLFLRACLYAIRHFTLRLCCMLDIDALPASTPRHYFCLMPAPALFTPTICASCCCRCYRYWRYTMPRASSANGMPIASPLFRHADTDYFH